MLLVNISHTFFYLENYKKRFTKMQSAKEYKSFIEGALSTNHERAKQFWHIKSK